MRIVGFAGSLREKSYNKAALRLVLDKVKEAGAEAEFIDLKPLSIPLYDGDLEDQVQLPEGVKLLREKIAAADGLILALAEYNHSISGVMKNTLDWLSRTDYFPSVLEGKPTATFGASDGNFGTVRAQIAFYPIANTLGLYLMPAKTYITDCDKKFDEAGNCTDSKTEERLAKFAQNFIEYVKRLS